MHIPISDIDDMNMNDDEKQPCLNSVAIVSSIPEIHVKNHPILNT